MSDYYDSEFDLDSNGWLDATESALCDSASVPRSYRSTSKGYMYTGWWGVLTYIVLYLLIIVGFILAVAIPPVGAYMIVKGLDKLGF